MFEGSNIAFKVDKKQTRSRASSIAIIIMNSLRLTLQLAKKRDDD